MILQSMMTMILLSMMTKTSFLGELFLEWCKWPLKNVFILTFHYIDGHLLLWSTTWHVLTFTIQSSNWCFRFTACSLKWPKDRFECVPKTFPFISGPVRLKRSWLLALALEGFFLKQYGNCGAFISVALVVCFRLFSEQSSSPPSSPHPFEPFRSRRRPPQLTPSV